MRDGNRSGFCGFFGVVEELLGALRSFPRGLVLAAAVNSTLVAGENLTVGSMVWLLAESGAPGR